MTKIDKTNILDFLLQFRCSLAPNSYSLFFGDEIFPSLDELHAILSFLFFDLRLEDAISQGETEKTNKLDKWREITDNTSRIIVDSRAKLNDIKSKDPHTTPEIQEQLEEIQVKLHVVWQANSLIYSLTRSQHSVAQWLIGALAHWLAR